MDVCSTSPSAAVDDGSDRNYVGKTMTSLLQNWIVTDNLMYRFVDCSVCIRSTAWRCFHVSRAEQAAWKILIDEK